MFYKIYKYIVSDKSLMKLAAGDLVSGQVNIAIAAMTMTSGDNVIKLFTAVSYYFS